MLIIHCYHCNLIHGHIESTEAQPSDYTSRACPECWPKDQLAQLTGRSFESDSMATYWPRDKWIDKDVLLNNNNR